MFLFIGGCGSESSSSKSMVGNATRPNQCPNFEPPKPDFGSINSGVSLTKTWLQEPEFESRSLLQSRKYVSIVEYPSVKAIWGYRLKPLTHGQFEWNASGFHHILGSWITFLKSFLPFWWGAQHKLQVTALGPLSRMPPLVELRRRTAARRWYEAGD